MKKISFLLVLIFCGSIGFSQSAGDKVKILSAGSWYDGKILEVDAEKGYYVSYDGWSETFNEWVGKDRLQMKGQSSAPAGVTGKFKVGDRVEASYGMVPEPATVIEVGTNKYHVKFDNSVFGSKWVTEKEIKPL